MANKVVLYVDGKNQPLAGSADGDKLTWSSATSSWVSAAGGAGTVTSITAGTGLSGGTITSSGTIALDNTTVTAASYGTTAAKTASFTVNAQGQLTAASEADIAIAASQVTSGQLAIARGGTNSSASPTAGSVAYGTGTALAWSDAGLSGQILQSNGASPPSWIAAPTGTVTSITAGTGLSGGTITTSGTISLPNVGTASTYGSASQVPVITTDAQGRVSSVTNTSIAIAASAVSAIPYDIAGSVAGTPTVSVDCFYFIAVRAASIAATGHRAKCKTAPSGTTTFTINKNGSSIGTIAFTVAGGTTGTVTITSGPVAVADGDEITLAAPANLNGLVDPRFTFKATVA